MEKEEQGNLTSLEEVYNEWKSHIMKKQKGQEADIRSKVLKNRGKNTALCLKDTETAYKSNKTNTQCLGRVMEERQCVQS